MAIDMNVDMGAIIKGLFSKKDPKDGPKSPPNPHVKTALVIGVILIAIASYVYFVYIPTKAELKIKNDKIALISSLKYEIESLSSSIETSQLELSIAQEEYKRRTNLFHTGQELEDLYGEISSLAMQNKLTITKIEKGVERPIFSEESCTDGAEDVSQGEYDDGMQPALKRVGYYEFGIFLEISGNYNQFTNFRNGLAQLTKIININKEIIDVPQSAENSAGMVKITSSIVTYRLPVNDAEKCSDPALVVYQEEY
jgi:Tfp pilus assembly protein PilO